MSDISAIVWPAVAIAVLHTAAGVDHTLPFALLARAQSWTLLRLWVVTALCGFAHVAASVALSLLGIAVGSAASQILQIENRRDEVASKLLIGLGLLYAAFGCYRSFRGRTGPLPHDHGDSIAGVKGATALALLLVFVLGPCEFLVAPLMAAHAYGWSAVITVALAFALSTIGTMLALVTMMYVGLSTRRLGFLDRHIHAIGGLTIMASGLAIELF